MGKKRIITVIEEGVKKKEIKRSLKEKKGVRVPGLKGGERVIAVTPEPVPVKEEKKEVPTAKKEAVPKPPRIRGKKYRAARAKIDPTKYYSPKEAIKLAKETSVTRSDGALEAHLITTTKGLKGEVQLPHFVGKPQRILIVTHKEIPNGKPATQRAQRSPQRHRKISASVAAKPFSDSVLQEKHSETPIKIINISDLENEIKQGLNYSTIIATPEMMPGLVKYAKILGPKGLMPNPKAGTIVKDPEKTIKTFQKASVAFKTEANAPLIHTVFGKTSQKEEELLANFQALINAIGPKTIKKVVICSTMGPGIKVELAP